MKGVDQLGEAETRLTILERELREARGIISALFPSNDELKRAAEWLARTSRIGL